MLRRIAAALAGLIIGVAGWTGFQAVTYDGAQVYLDKTLTSAERTLAIFYPGCTFTTTKDEYVGSYQPTQKRLAATWPFLINTNMIEGGKKSYWYSITTVDTYGTVRVYHVVLHTDCGSTVVNGKKIRLVGDGDLVFSVGKYHEIVYFKNLTTHKVFTNASDSYYLP